MRLLGCLLVMVAAVSAQEPVGPPERWHFFVSETVNPLTPLGGAFFAGLEHISRSEPNYGGNSLAYGERFGAALADITGQNFFVDFAMASAFHEDTRYVRRGPENGGIWYRVGYAISSGFVTHTDSGGRTFNWANLAGTALSTGVSDLYYPPSGRRPASMAIRFGTDVVTTGLVALFPEFWPDFRGMLQRHHLFPHR